MAKWQWEWGGNKIRNIAHAMGDYSEKRQSFWGAREICESRPKKWRTIKDNKIEHYKRAAIKIFFFLLNDQWSD